MHMLHSFAHSAATQTAGVKHGSTRQRSQWATRMQPEVSSRLHSPLTPMITTRVEQVSDEHSAAHSKVEQTDRRTGLDWTARAALHPAPRLHPDRCERSGESAAKIAMHVAASS